MGTRRRLLLHGGRIWTRASAQAPVESLLLEDGAVVAAGKAQEAAGAAAERIDLEGRTVLPGLIDSHIHLEQYARRLIQLDLAGLSLQECLRSVQRASEQLQEETWILGHAWDQNEWERYGRAQDLDAIAPQHPVYLTAKSLHSAWTNSLGLRLAEIDAHRADPTGGEIQRDAEGEPTGILFEKAMQLVAELIPKPSPQELSRQVLTAQRSLWSLGITGVHDFDGERCFRALQILRQQRQLGLRVLKSIPVALLEHAAALGLQSGFGDEWIRIGHVKAFADGALGPRTAAMFAPYEGEPDNLGISLLDKEEILEIGLRSVKAGLPLAVHAIGDRANHDVLDAVEALREQEKSLELPALPHRIEHLQLLHPDDLSRPGALGVIASMQPIHATSDMFMADRHWGERARSAYAWNSILSSGARLAFGSDAPVEDPNPFLGLHAAINRARPGQRRGWYPEQRLQRDVAMAAYTEGAAFMDRRQGRLEYGSYADLIVLENDYFEMDATAIAELRPVGTMVAGEWRFKAF